MSENEHEIAPTQVPAASGGEVNPASNSGRLTEEQKIYIVGRLAAYHRPADIVRGLRAEFGVRVCRQSIDRYDPTRSVECPDVTKMAPQGSVTAERQSFVIHQQS